MKKVLSISVGSSSRDHTTEAEFLGQHFWLSRQGTNGSFDKAVQMYREYDGKVDAFGVGGCEFYLSVNGRRYYFRDPQRIRRAVKISKIGDGNGLKHILEPLAIPALRAHGVDLRGKKVLHTAGVDRYGLARALVEAGCDVTFGDFMFGLGIPIPLHSLSAIHVLAALILPWLTKLPYKWVYPVGAEQDRPPSQKYNRFYKAADVIAGDFLQVRAHLPGDLAGKIVITNTTTAEDVEQLQRCNLHILVTTTPRLGGRSFGTNMIEAVCRCLLDKPDSQIGEADFCDLIERIPLEPQVHVLN